MRGAKRPHGEPDVDDIEYAEPPETLRRLYANKTIESRLMGRTLRLDLPVDVFSSFQVDRGTRRLLRQIQAAAASWNAALDLGCGYGPIALHLAAAGVAGRCTAVDRDALAVSFTAANARHNDLANVEAHGAIA